MFEPQATIRWVTAVFQDPDAAAVSYRDAAPGWQQSFMELTLPLYVGAYVVAAIVALITGGTFLLGAFTFGIVVFSVLWSLAWTFVIAFIFDYLAGMFEGKRDFEKAYAVVALAIVPAAAGTALSPVPWLGWLISLAGSIYSLMLAYRFLPVFLEIPEASRVKHFVLSVVAALVVNIVVSATIGAMFVPVALVSSSVMDSSSTTVSSGMFGGLERQAEMVEEASADSYDPPSDGRLTEAQVRVFVRMLEKTQGLRERLGKPLEDLEDAEPTLSDVFSSVGGAMRMGTAEMEVVKTAGGNWAEHQWVRAQLELARVQQDLNDAVAHNYRLFQKYQDDIEQFE